MSETADRGKLLAQVGWAVFIAATLYVCYFSHLGALGFVGPDEPRYAWIARDMAETGDWVTPRLYGKPWFEKPVLYYWGAALCFKLFGVSETAARLPSAISALLATLALACLAWKQYGAETARWLLLLLPTTVGMIGFSHAASMDMPFSGMLTIAMVAAAVVLGLTRSKETSSPPESPAVHETHWLALIAFGVFLGAAALAKGPAAIILASGTVFFWALFTNRWRDAFRLFHPAAIGSFCAIAMPWYFLCARRNPDFFRVFIIEHNFQRYLTSEFRHVQPLWYYAPILFIGLIPWVSMAISVLGDMLRRKPKVIERDASSLFLAASIVFPFIFFTISKSKLPGYILPVIPPASFLTAKYLAAGLRSTPRWKPLGLSFFALTPVAIMATISFLIFHFFREHALHLVVASGAAAFLGLNACLVFAFSRRWHALAVSGILTLVLGVEIFDRTALPWFDPFESPRAIAVLVRGKPQIAQQVQTFRLRRGAQYALNFYLHRELVEWDGTGAEPVFAFASPGGINQLRARKIPFTIVDSTCLDAFLVQIGRPEATGGMVGNISAPENRFLDSVTERGGDRRLKIGVKTEPL